MIKGDIVDAVDFVTKLPGKVSDLTDRYNDKTIGFLQDLENALADSGKVAEQNLRQNKIKSIGRDVAAWLSRPGNLTLAGGGVLMLVVLLILAMRK